jgi:hypothetical protein
MAEGEARLANSPSEDSWYTVGFGQLRFRDGTHPFVIHEGFEESNAVSDPAGGMSLVTLAGRDKSLADRNQ